MHRDLSGAAQTTFAPYNGISSCAAPERSLCIMSTSLDFQMGFYYRLEQRNPEFCRPLLLQLACACCMIGMSPNNRRDDPVLLGKLEAVWKAIEDFLYYIGPVDGAKDPHPAAAAITFQNVQTENTFNELRPTIVPWIAYVFILPIILHRILLPFFHSTAFQNRSASPVLYLYLYFSRLIPE
jgi:hypothetical protein